MDLSREHIQSEIDALEQLVKQATAQEAAFREARQRAEGGIFAFRKMLQRMDAPDADPTPAAGDVPPAPAVKPKGRRP